MPLLESGGIEAFLRCEVPPDAADVRDAITELSVGKISAPVSTSKGISLFMVCQREKLKNNLPKREEIVNQIRRGRLGMMSRRYMRDLRIAAIVDIRV